MPYASKQSQLRFFCTIDLLSGWLSFFPTFFLCSNFFAHCYDFVTAKIKADKVPRGGGLAFNGRGNTTMS